MSGFADSKLSAEVADGVRRGDPEAIASAYRTLGQAVINLAARILKDRALAEEVVQDTFVELVEKAGQIRSSDAVVAWVKRVAVNHCLMRLRSPWHSRRAAEAEELPAPEHDGDLEWAAQVTSIEQALGSLTSETRAVIWLHDVEGYTHKEIGELMGKTSSYSKSQLARGYEKLLAWSRLRERPAAVRAGDEKDNGQEQVGTIGTPCIP